MSSAANAAGHDLKKRYRRILRFASSALLQTWWFELVLPKFGLRAFVAKNRVKRIQNLARKFRYLAADLGGLIIKVGQFASSRLDVLPKSITAELESLQDEVEPIDFDQIREQIEAQLGMKVGMAFESFDSEPIAAASLGQAYRATLTESLHQETGSHAVVVKVLRPGIEAVVEVDLKALRKVARWLSRIKLVNRRADAPELVEEFAQVSLEEINYFVEAANLSRFSENFAENTRINTPEIIWERSSKKVLTLSDVTGIKISSVDELLAAGIDPNKVAGELATATFEQIFVHGFFHADPHPGNIFVNLDPDVPGEFKLSFIDFGMMGEISDEQRQGLQSLIFALVARDARRCVAAMQRLGLLLSSADTVELERAVAVVFDRFGGVGVAELTQTDPREIKELIVQFSDLFRQLPFQLPEDFLMLLRAVSLISGVTSSLNRDFNMWDAVDPFARSLLNGGSNPTLKAVGREVLSFGATVAGLPKKLESVLGLMDQGKLAVRLPEVEKAVRRLDGSVRRLASAALFATALIAGVLLRINQDTLGDWLIIGSVPFLIHAIGFFRIK